MRKSLRIAQIDGRLVRLTNLEKVLFPSTGFAKRDLVRYYSQIGPTVLPHLMDRPFTFKRYPEGVNRPSFFEKNCPSHRPSWIQTGRLDDVRHCLINDLPSLIWSANLGAIELHTTLATIDDTSNPTMLVFDLDPGEGAGVRECAEVALLLRERLSDYSTFVKSSGSKGLHVYLPLNSSTGFGTTKAFARLTAETLERSFPDRVVSKMSKSLRAGRVFIDWSQNTDFKTTTTVYSLRAGEVPTVSTPLHWKEVERAARRASDAARLNHFTPEDVLARVDKWGDLFEPVLEIQQRLPAPTLLRTRVA